VRADSLTKPEHREKKSRRGAGRLKNHRAEAGRVSVLDRTRRTGQRESSKSDAATGYSRAWGLLTDGEKRRLKHWTHGAGSLNKRLPLDSGGEASTRTSFSWGEINMRPTLHRYQRLNQAAGKSTQENKFQPHKKMENELWQLGWRTDLAGVGWIFNQASTEKPKQAKRLKTEIWPANEGTNRTQILRNKK
jgi:hypothetical protein